MLRVTNDPGHAKAQVLPQYDAQLVRPYLDLTRILSATLQVMACVRSGQAPASPLILTGGGTEAPQSRVANGHFRRKRDSVLDSGGVPSDTQRAITGPDQEIAGFLYDSGL
jgi:hypothetical protein